MPPGFRTPGPGAPARDGVGGRGVPGADGAGRGRGRDERGGWPLDAWEYRRESAATPETLSELGAGGWELVGVDGGVAHLKRPSPSYRQWVTGLQREAALRAPAPQGAPAGRRRLLHPETYRLFAQAGHTDLITVCDRGFPVPRGPERLDLAVADDLPTVLDLLGLLAPLFPPARLVVPEEARLAAPGRLAALGDLLPDTPLDFLPHAAFKDLAATARATVRTGDATPYANVIWVG